jgi:hypothetical protein
MVGASEGELLLKFLNVCPESLTRQQRDDIALNVEIVIINRFSQKPEDIAKVPTALFLIRFGPEESGKRVAGMRLLADRKIGEEGKYFTRARVSLLTIEQDMRRPEECDV